MKLFNIDVQKVKTINLLLPKGYKLITPDELQKRKQQKLKKKPILSKINSSQLAISKQILITPSRNKQISEVPNSSFNKSFDSKFALNIVEPAQKSSEQLKFPNHSEIRINPTSKKLPEVKLPEVKLPAQTQLNNSTTSINLSFLARQQKIEERKPKKIYVPIQLPDSKNKYQEILIKVKNNPCAQQIVNLDLQHQNIEMGFKKIYELAGDQTVTLGAITSQMNKLFLKGYSFYPKNTQSYNNIVELEKYFKKLTDDVKKEEARMMAMYPPILQSQNSVSGKSQIENKRGRVLGKTYNTSSGDFGLSVRQKRTLGQNIKKLSSDALKGIIKIVYDSKDTKDNREEYVIDLDNMATKKLRQLQTYVKSCNLSNLDERNSQSKIDRDDQMSNQDQSFVIQDESG